MSGRRGTGTTCPVSAGGSGGSRPYPRGATASRGAPMLERPGTGPREKARPVSPSAPLALRRWSAQGHP